MGRQDDYILSLLDYQKQLLTAYNYENFENYMNSNGLGLNSKPVLFLHIRKKLLNVNTTTPSANEQSKLDNTTKKVSKPETSSASKPVNEVKVKIEPVEVLEANAGKQEKKIVAKPIISSSRLEYKKVETKKRERSSSSESSASNSSSDSDSPKRRAKLICAYNKNLKESKFSESSKLSSQSSSNKVPSSTAKSLIFFFK